MIHRLPITLAILALAAALSTLSATAQTMLDRLDGLYYPQGYGAWDCQTLGMDGGAVGVRDGMLHGVESSCRLDNGKAVPGFDAMVFGTTCTGEGMEWDGGNVILIPAQNGAAMTLVREGGFATTWQRCGS